MIRKPPQDWQRRESVAVGTVRAAAAAAGGGVSLVRTGALYVRALVLLGFAALWGFCALAAGASGSLPTLVGVGAMSLGAGWAGRRMLAKARAER